MASGYIYGGRHAVVKRNHFNEAASRGQRIRTNRKYQKRDHDAAEWLPTHNRCWFAATIVAVRQEYDLTIDRREAAALDAVLKGCDD